MQWKNGGGETIEIAVSPADAQFDTFDWRLSMAHVGESGPFSLFPGIDRTLSVISGAGLALRLAGAETVTLDRHSAPFEFAGDIAVDSMLIAGPIDDLNVMTRRGRCRHCVARHTFAAPTELRWEGDVGIVVPIDAEVDIAGVRLSPKDAALFEPGDPAIFIAAPHAKTDLFLIEITD